jgi:hypothetical protein
VNEGVQTRYGTAQYLPPSARSPGRTVCAIVGILTNIAAPIRAGQGRARHHDACVEIPGHSIGQKAGEMSRALKLIACTDADRGSL